MNHENVVTPEQAMEEMRRLAKKIERSSSKSLDAMKDIQRDCQEKIQELKYELSTDLIAKANEPVARVVSVLNWILLAVVVIGGALAWLTTSSLKSTLETLMTQRIESWLSLDDQHSPASKTFDAYRTRALLDSYMIQLARQKSQHSPIVNLRFKVGDQKRLMAIVRSPSSDHQDFYDALRLLAVAGGEWGVIVGENELGRDLVGLIEDPHFDSRRKLDILQILSRNKNLVDVEARYLQDASAPEALRYQSYLNLKDYDKGSPLGELALKYATNLLQSTSRYKVEEALEHIAAADPFNADLAAFLQSLPELQRDARMDYRLAVAKGWITQLPSPDMMSFYLPEETEPVDREAIRARVATLISDLLEDGLMLGMDNTLSGRSHLAIRYAQVTGTAIIKSFPLERLLGDQQLMQAIYEHQYPKGLERFARFFSVADRGEVVALAKLTVLADALGVGSDPSQPKEIVGRFEFVPDAKLRFTWRDSLGDWQSRSIDALEKARVSMVFDKDAISYKGVDPTDWIF
ncbi:hypothetical protein [Pseudomonas sp. FP2300]|uniref:hypothetical protein n=1 Tax=Pseudomonas sp. FP2300 TaxID=2954090 RepID=UPI0027359329|nr:hypothetical protein [Pseudomonas sp. FP2300]WLH65105.1 hypothetical protein PSH86_11230 [Pseudomonas sp. FP2300]